MHPDIVDPTVWMVVLADELRIPNVSDVDYDVLVSSTERKDVIFSWVCVVHAAGQPLIKRGGDGRVVRDWRDRG